MELTPVLFAVAADGDDVASDLVRRQAEEVVALSVAAKAMIAQGIDLRQHLGIY